MNIWILNIWVSESTFVFSDLNVQYYKTWNIPKVGKKSEWVLISTFKFENSILQNLVNPWNLKKEWVSLYLYIQISIFNHAKHRKSLKSEKRVSESEFVYSDLNIQYFKTWKVPKIGKRVSESIFQHWNFKIQLCKFKSTWKIPIIGK